MIKQKLQDIITGLQAALDDAGKVDDGKAGTPGTRLRAAAQTAKAQLDDLRKDVLAARDASE